MNNEKTHDWLLIDTPEKIEEAGKTQPGDQYKGLATGKWTDVEFINVSFLPGYIYRRRTQPTQSWISVRERLPNHSRYIPVASAGKTLANKHCYDGTGWYEDGNLPAVKLITHWYDEPAIPAPPLPPPTSASEKCYEAFLAQYKGHDHGLIGQPVKAAIEFALDYAKQTPTN